jgi:hypothetical protein
MKQRSRRKRASADRESSDTARAKSAQPDFVMERFGRIEDAGRSFDIEFWQRQGDAAIFRAAWEMAEFYHRQQGMKPDEFRLQRSIESFQRA